MLKGACNCGAVSFIVSGEVPPPSLCHCGQCRKQSGHVWSSSHAPESAVEITGADRLTWYQSSEQAKRGFCSTCGAFLFWKHEAEDHISFAMGALEAPTRLRLGKQIFTSDRGDYYELDDRVPLVGP